MSDWFFKQGGRDRLVNWLGIDAWLDSKAADLWSSAQDTWNNASTFFSRFRLSGWKRLLNEGVSECLTIGAGGLVAMYTLALPAFQEIEEGRWLSTGKYSVTFQDRNGNEIGKRGINLSDAVPLEEIPEHLIKATLATEDRRFWDHFGVDVLGTLRALSENLRANAAVQGGSTLTQQLAKNLFLSSEKSLTRKLKELFLSFWLESRLTKREILKLYFDRAYMGGGAFGVEAASQFYFGKSVREVTMAEAAMMAGLFKAPTKYAPHVNLPASRARTNEVLDNLIEAGFYTPGQVHAARLNPAKVVEPKRTYSPDWFLDWAFEEIQRVMEGRNAYVLTARTTIDLTMQQQAETALTSTIRQNGKSNNVRSGSMVVMDPDGAVRAIVGGMDYGESQFNRATQARRQPGSSFKLYVYASAMENGYHPNSNVRDSSRSCGNWHPQNYSGGHGGGGAMPLWMAFAKSLNTTAAELSFAVGREKVIDMTLRLGVKGVRKTCSMALGDTGISPIEHVGAYAHFANGGKAARPYAIIEATTSKGDAAYSRERDEPPAQQVLSRKVAEGMNQIMQKVVTDGTGKRAILDFTHSAGKTGTSSSYRDAWFVGFTGALVAGVWLGNDDFRPMSNVTGGALPAQAWHTFMSVAHGNMPIPVIPGLSPHPNQINNPVAKPAEVAGAGSAGGAGGTTRKSSLMSEQSRQVLKTIAGTLRKVGGLPEPAPEPDPAAKPRGPAQPERRAEFAAPPGATPAAAGTSTKAGQGAAGQPIRRQ